MATLATQGLVTADERFLRAALMEVEEGERRRGICLLLGGHSEFIEKYGEVAGELQARGFTVAALDWRGQGASERLGRSNYAGHVARFSDYELDLSTLLKDVVHPLLRAHGRMPVIALAHSMGAHILLRFLHDYPGRIEAGVLSAPMLGINIGPFKPWVAKLLVFLVNLRRPLTAFVPGAAERDPLTQPFAANPVTSDEARFERTRQLLAEQPYLRIFGPSFGWLGAALKSIAQVTRPRYAAEIETPLLIVAAGADRIVSTRAIRDFVKLLPHARYLEIADAKHEILMEKDAIRTQFWEAFDAFIDAQLKG